MSKKLITDRKFPKIVPGSMKQRVQIAKDVIAQVKAGRFVPTSGVYVRIAGNPDGHPIARTSDATALTARVKRCKVCAVGSLLIAMVDRYDALKLEGCTPTLYYAASGLGDRGYLYSLFGDANDIEAAFEATTSDSWYLNFPDDGDRLIAIMRNIIRNDGAFVSDDIPETRKRAGA